MKFIYLKPKGYKQNKAPGNLHATITIGLRTISPNSS